MGTPRGGRPQPLGGSRESSPGPLAGAGQVAAPGLSCAEEAASLARGGGRGGPGITWAEAGPGVPGGLSPESGRRLRRERRRLLAFLLPSLRSPARPPSPTGEREPGERAHLRAVRTAGDLPGPGAFAALRACGRLGARTSPPRTAAPRSLACGRRPPLAGLSRPGCSSSSPRRARVLWSWSSEGARSGQAGPTVWAPPRGPRSGVHWPAQRSGNPRHLLAASADLGPAGGTEAGPGQKGKPEGREEGRQPRSPGRPLPRLLNAGSGPSVPDRLGQRL